jgi:hypothetical protein
MIPYGTPLFYDLRNKSDEELREMIRQEMETLQKLETQDAEVRGWKEEARLLPEKEPREGADDAPV